MTSLHPTLQTRKLSHKKKSFYECIQLLSIQGLVKIQRGFPSTEVSTKKPTDNAIWAVDSSMCSTSHYYERKELENGKPLLANKPNFKQKKFVNFLEYQYT